MKTMKLTALGVILSLYAMAAFAECSTTYMNGGTMICQTCCNNGVCNTNCWQR